MYNMTNVTSANTFYGILSAGNQLSEGMFWGTVMLVIFILIFMVFKNFDTKTVLVLDSFVMTIIGIISLTLGLIGAGVLVIFVILLFASILIYLFVE